MSKAMDIVHHSCIQSKFHKIKIFEIDWNKLRCIVKSPVYSSHAKALPTQCQQLFVM
jgi:hypothetical protein